MSAQRGRARVILRAGDLKKLETADLTKPDIGEPQDGKITARPNGWHPKIP